MGVLHLLFCHLQVIAWVRSSCTVIAASADASLSVWEMSKKTFREVGAWGASGSGFCTPQSFSLSIGIHMCCTMDFDISRSLRKGRICFTSRKRATICFHNAERSYSLRVALIYTHPHTHTEVPYSLRCLTSRCIHAYIGIRVDLW